MGRVCIFELDQEADEIVHRELHVSRERLRMGFTQIVDIDRMIQKCRRRHEASVLCSDEAEERCE